MHCVYTLYEFYVVPQPPGFHARIGKEIRFKMTEQDIATPRALQEATQSAWQALQSHDAQRPFLQRLRDVGADGPDTIAACRNALAAVTEQDAGDLEGIEWSLVSHVAFYEGARVVCATKALVL